jgi:hypothetical protein
LLGIQQELGIPTEVEHPHEAPHTPHIVLILWCRPPPVTSFPHFQLIYLVCSEKRLLFLVLIAQFVGGDHHQPAGCDEALDADQIRDGSDSDSRGRKFFFSEETKLDIYNFAEAGELRLGRCNRPAMIRRGVPITFCVLLLLLASKSPPWAIQLIRNNQ